MEAAQQSLAPGLRGFAFVLGGLAYVSNGKKKMGRNVLISNQHGSYLLKVDGSVQIEAVTYIQCPQTRLLTGRLATYCYYLHAY